MSPINAQNNQNLGPLCPYRHRSTTRMAPNGSQESTEEFLPCMREKCIAYQKIGNTCSCNVGSSKWIEN